MLPMGLLMAGFFVVSIALAVRVQLEGYPVDTADPVSLPG
jgi:hypothetical protein